MSAELVRIVYCSRGTLAGSRADIEVQIRRILASARRNNQAAQLTGAMAFNTHWFAQVLEGATADLAPIFERIRRDPRHCNLRILEQTRATQRLFPHWSMAYADSPDDLRQHPLAHFSFEAALTTGAAPQARKMLDALQRFITERNVPART